MNKEVISDRQGTMLMILFLMGSTLVLGSGSTAKQDVWIANILGTALAIPVFFIYARILAIFPGKDLFDILNSIFGGIIGRIIAVLFVWYAFHLGALVIRNFSEFIRVNAMPETPQYVLAIFMGLLCIWAVKDGIEVLGRFSAFVFPITTLIIVTIIILSTTKMQLSNVKPILYNGFGPILGSVFSIFSFPFAEAIVFTMVFTSLKSNKSSYKIYFLSLGISSVLFILVSMRNILVLGAEYCSGLYFSSYTAVSVVNIGDFLQRIELSVAMIFLFAGFIKISICLYAASNGIAKIFGLENYRPIVAPVGQLMMLMSGIVYRSTMEMVEWAVKVYMYYAIPFQIILPIIVLIGAEIKIRLKQVKYTR